MVMSIRCENPDCQKTLRVKNALAGKRLKCPACGHIVVVAALSATLPPSARSVVADAHKSGHVADLPPQCKTTRFRRPWLAGAATGALVGGLLVGGLIFWSARSNLAMSRDSVESAKAELVETKAEAASLKANSELQSAERTKSRAELEVLKAETAKAIADGEATRVELAQAKADAETVQIELVQAKADAKTAQIELARAKADAKTAQIELARANPETHAGEPPLVSDLDAAVKKLNESAAAAEKSKDKKILLALRMALYELDVAVLGNQPTEAEKLARHEARALLARVKVPAPYQEQVWKLYSKGFFSFGDVNAVAKGDAEDVEEYLVGTAKWLYCTTHKPVPGLTLYKEDLDLIMAKAEGILQSLDKGSAFIGQVTLSDKGDLSMQAALLRKALSLQGGTGVRIDFHEGPNGTVVVAKVTTVE